MPDLVCRSDISFIAIAIAINEDWLHMAATLDLFCHQVVGWSRKPHLAVSCAAGYDLRWLLHAVAKLGIGPALFCLLRMVLLPAMALRSA